MKGKMVNMTQLDYHMLQSAPGSYSVNLDWLLLQSLSVQMHCSRPFQVHVKLGFGPGELPPSGYFNAKPVWALDDFIRHMESDFTDEMNDQTAKC